VPKPINEKELDGGMKDYEQRTKRTLPVTEKNGDLQQPPIERLMTNQEQL
jgi:hypothetical protein